MRFLLSQLLFDRLSFNHDGVIHHEFTQHQLFNHLLFNHLLAAPPKNPGQFPVWFTAVYVVGFIAAVSIGSLAWYNSKRPPGWENSERPDFVPEVKDKNLSE